MHRAAGLATGSSVTFGAGGRSEYRLPPVAPVLTGRAGVAAEPQRQDVEYPETQDDEQDHEQFHCGPSPFQGKPDDSPSTRPSIRARIGRRQSGATHGDNSWLEWQERANVLECAVHAAASWRGLRPTRRAFRPKPNADLLDLRPPLRLDGGEDEVADDRATE